MADPAVAVAGDTLLQSVVLDGLNEAPNYRRWLASLAEPYLGHDPLEIGSGTGDYAAQWAQPGRRFTATEADPARLALLRQRFADDDLVTVTELALPTTVEAEHTAVVALNVLEHIDDDLGALEACRRLVRPGGAVVIIVPAFEFAMSAFDREIGHVRRYRVADVRQRMRAVGLWTGEIRYVNPLGLAAWFVGMRMCRLRPGAGPALRFWDRFVVPTAQRWESNRRPLFGQSVFAVGWRA